MKVIRRFINWFFGYDYFISYSWEDGRSYAKDLFQQLNDNGFKCFLDSRNYAKGDDWKKVGKRTLRNTACLVLVVTPKALSSVPVHREVQIFSNTRRRIIPININQTLQKEINSKLVKYLPDKILRIDELTINNQPSRKVLNDIILSFNLVKQSTKRLRFAVISSFVFLILTIASIGLSFLTLKSNSNLKHQQKINQSTILYLKAERISNSLSPDYSTMNILATESFRSANNLDALSLIRSKIGELGVFKKGYTIPWNLGNADKIQYSDDMQNFIHYSYKEILIYRTLDGHLLNKITGLNRIKYAVISPNGKYIAVACSTKDRHKILNVYKISLSINSSIPNLVLSIPFEPVTSRSLVNYKPIAFNDLSDQIVIAQKNRVTNNDQSNAKKINWIKVYNLNNGEEVNKFAANARPESVRMYGNIVFYSGYTVERYKKNIIRLFDLKQNKIIKGFKFINKIYDFSISNDSKLLAIASGTSLYMHSWDSINKNLKKLKTLRFESGISSIKFNADAQRFLVSLFNKYIYVFNKIDYSQEYFVEASWPVGQVGFIDKETIITVRKYSGPISFEFWLNNNKINPLLTFNDPVYTNLYPTIKNQMLDSEKKSLLRITDEGTNANEESDRNVRIYNLELPSTTYKSFKISGQTAALSQNGQFLALEYGNGEIHIWNLIKDKIIKKVRFTDNEHELLTFLSFDPQSKFLFAATHEPSQNAIDNININSHKDLIIDDSIKIWPLNNSSSKPIIHNEGLATGYAISPSGNQLLSTTNFGISMWNKNNRKILFNINSDYPNVMSGDHFIKPQFLNRTNLFSVVTYRGDGNKWLELRSTLTGEINSRYSLVSEINSQLFIPELNLLLLGLNNGQIIIIDILAKKQVQSFNHGKSIKNLYYSYERNSLVSNSIDEQDQVKIWTISRSQVVEVNRFSTNDSQIVWIINDSLQILGEHSFKSIPIDHEYWLNKIKHTIKQNISLVDWLSYFPDLPYSKTFPNKPIGELNGNITLKQFRTLFKNTNAIAEPEFFTHLLFWAVAHNRSELILFLKEKKTNLNISSLDNHPKKYSALVESVRLGHFDVFLALINNGAQWDNNSKFLDSPLWVALSLSKRVDINVQKIINELIKRGAHKSLLQQERFIISDESLILIDMLEDSTR